METAMPAMMRSQPVCHGMTFLRQRVRYRHVQERGIENIKCHMPYFRFVRSGTNESKKKIKKPVIEKMIPL